MGARSRHSSGTALYQREVDFEGICFTVACSAPNDLYFATLDASPLPPALSLASVCCPPDGVIVDVGANIGVAALGFSRICPEGSVVAVEPGGRAYADLRAGIALNGASNVRAVKAAVGDVEGYAVLHEVTWNTAGSFLRRDASPASDAHTTAGTVEARVRVTTLDNLVDHENLARVDLVKIDVEGNEPKVLDGATRTLDRFHPLVVVEFNVFTLSVMAGRNPLAFLLELLERFPYLYAVDIELRIAPVRSIADAYLVTAQCFGDGYGVELVGAYEPFERTSLPGKGQRRAIAALQGRVAELEADIARLESRSASLDDEGGAEHARRVDIEAERAALELELRDREARLRALLGSRSWRMTAPLRRLRGRARVEARRAPTRDPDWGWRSTA